MAKRTSKSDLILEQARKGVERARDLVRTAEVELRVANARLNAHEVDLQALEQQLAREPRRPKSVAPSAGRKSKQKEPAKELGANTEGETVVATTAFNGAARCAIPNCGLPEGSAVHQPESELNHKFHATIKTKGAGAALAVGASGD